MSGFVTRWPVLLRELVTPADLESAEAVGTAGRGDVSAAAVMRWRERACTAYLDRCVSLQHLRQESLLDWVLTDAAVRAVVGLGHPDAVALSARATEIDPFSFMIAVRVRALDPGTDAVLDLGARVALVDPRTGTTRALDPDIREELIAIEHAAAHLN